MKKILFYILIIIIFTRNAIPVQAEPPCPASQIQIDGVCVTPPERCFPTPLGVGIPFWDPLCVQETICLAPSVVENGVCIKKDYQLLTPLPDPSSPGNQITTFDPTNDKALGHYLNVILKIFIGICAVLAMVMIVLGGIEYMTSELISSKESGKKKITGAIFGLILALGSYALLNTINPKLLITDVKIGDVIVQIELEPEVGIATETIGLLSNLGLVQLKACDESQMVTMSAFGKNVTVYKGVVKSLERISNRWFVSPEDVRYPVNSIYGYDCRKVTNKPGSWSAHAFGLAVDINPNTNPYSGTLIEDLPSGFPGLFITEGWGWGGNWDTVKDPMHFSKYPLAEGGNGSVEF